jgi:hypothetical protein
MGWVGRDLPNQPIRFVVGGGHRLAPLSTEFIINHKDKLVICVWGGKYPKRISPNS